MTKTLIACFSHAGQNYSRGGIRNLEVGNTRVAAEKLRNMIGSDLFYIDTVEKYPEDHMEKIAVAKAEYEANARPELTEKKFGGLETAQNRCKVYGHRGFTR